MTLSTLVAPASEPLSADDPVLKLHLQPTGIDSDENQLLEAYIASARSMVETYLRKRLITQTVRLTLDGFGCGGSSAIRLPVFPVQDVDQVQYLDGAGVWQTVDASQYRLVDSVAPFRLAPVYGGIWPVPRLDRATVHIDLVVGYGENGSDVHPDILQALRLQVAHMFCNRGDMEGTGGLCGPARTLLAPLVLWL